MLTERANPADASVTLTSCASCGAALVLECEPARGFMAYRTYNEFACAKCRKHNVVLSSGAVLAVRVAGTGTD